MRLEGSGPSDGEPAGGWVGSPALVDTQILHLLLCRFTGSKVALRLPCPSREQQRHPDVECKTMFLQAEGLQLALLDGLLFPEANDEIRAPYLIAGEAIGTGHL